MHQKDSTGRRPYRMRARAKATAETRESILDAAEAVFDEGRFDELTLAAVAERAGVTVQTILRHYGTRQGMLAAALARLGARMRNDRDSAPVGDVGGAVRILVDHYEAFGERILLLLANEERHPFLRALAEGGRAYHLEWCEQVFAPALRGLRGAQRERRASQLVAVTDIYVWKLLRRDRGLSRQQAKLAMRELLDPLMENDR